jgi:hypothetical protein
MTEEFNQNSPPRRRKKEKVYYATKKDAVSKLNYLQMNPHTKKRPLRVYEDENGWHLTKLQLIDNISLIDLLTAAIKYSDSKRYGSGGVYKREWEEEKRLRDIISKQLKIYNELQ